MATNTPVVSARLLQKGKVLDDWFDSDSILASTEMCVAKQPHQEDLCGTSGDGA